MNNLPPPALCRAPLFILSVALTVGLLCARVPETQSRVVLVLCVSLSAALSAVSVLLVRSRKSFAASVCVVTAFLLTGLSLGIADTSTRARNRLSLLYEQGTIAEGDPVDLTATVDGMPERAPDRIYIRVRAQKLTFKQIEYNCSGVVFLTAHVADDERRRAFDALELRHGARIRVMVALDREDTFRNPGVMQLTEYLERNDFEATGVIKSPLLVERLDDDTVFLPLGWLYDWRETLQQKFAATFSPETSGVLNAALLGNRYGLSQSAADRFRAGGTFHVLVISGMQISFIGALVFFGAGWFTRKRIWRFAIATFLIWSYTVAVGSDAPVARAALMFTLVILAPVIWRRANSLNVIGATALMLLVWRPKNLFDPSFQLTFLSVLAIVLLAVPLMQTMQRVGSWVPTGLTPYPPQCSDWFRKLSEALFWSEAKWRAELAASNINYRLFKTPLAAKLERQLADVAHGDAFGQRVAARRHRLAGQDLVHRRVARGLDADHLEVGLERARRHGAARDHAAAAHRHDQRVELRRILQHLERHRALTRDDTRIVVGMDEHEFLLCRDAPRLGGRFGQRVAVQHHRRAMAARVADLGVGRKGRHHDGGRNTEAPGVIGDALRVVAGRHGDHAALALLVCELQQRVQRAAFLERGGELQVLELDPDV